MLRRCDNPSDKRWHRYGGRGIIVCDRWANSFEAFVADMGPRPEGLSVERLDNNRGYGPDNCRWGTCTEQARNTIRNRKVTLFGLTAPLVFWTEAFDLSYHMVKKRLNRGWSDAQAFGAEDLLIAWG